MRMIINFLMVIVVLISSSVAGAAQEQQWNQQFVDSILPRLPNIKADVNSVDQLRRLSEMYYTRNLDSTVLFADIGDSIAESIHYYEGQVACLVGSAMAHALHSDWAGATLKMNKALPICRQHTPDLMLLMYNIMFAISGIKGEYDEADKWKNVQLRLLVEYKGPEWVKWPTYMQMAIFYEKSNQLDSARFYADSLKVYLKKYEHQSEEIRRDSYMALGNIALRDKDTVQAIQYYRLGPYPQGIAEIYQFQGNRDSTIFYAEKDLKNWIRLNSPHNIIPPARILASEYDSINPAESNKYLKIYINAVNSYYTTDKQLAQVRLNQERLENELQARDAENRNKISMIIAASIVILLCGFSYLLWRNNRFKQKANKKLEQSYKELESAQAQLVQSEKMASLGELTAGIAHEIQNPLNFVNNFSEVNRELLGELNQEAERGNIEEVKVIARDLLNNEEKISFHGRRADAIVKSMLQHSRTSNNQKEKTDINSLVDEYTRLAYHGMRAKDKSFNANLSTSYDPDAGSPEIVPQDIGRVLLNLLNNAFYAVNEKRRKDVNGYDPAVTVETKRMGNQLEISVTDNGEGIPKNLRDKIFQPFFTTKPTGEGTGLGLSLSYDIIKSHGGDIKVESEESRNTTFRIKLPAN
jgi:two-component system NtrC family sensor kinase